MTSTPTQYMLTITRFSCGCLYRTSTDQAVFCPAHRHRSPVGFITGVETIKAATPVVPHLARLTMHPTLTGIPLELRCTQSNSLHQQVHTLDAQGNEWDRQTDQTGLCAACLVEHQEPNETRIAACECGDPDCSYRWCGSTQGVHAYWRLHAQDLSQQSTGIPNRDIFSHGPEKDLSQQVRAVLETERKDLNKQADRLLQATLHARRIPSHKGLLPAAPGHTSGSRRRTSIAHPVHLSRWLDRECEAIAAPATTPRHREASIRTIKPKLLRLYIIGAMPSDSASEQPDSRRQLPLLLT